jgi:hypothetical protein
MSSGHLPHMGQQHTAHSLASIPSEKTRFQHLGESIIINYIYITYSNEIQLYKITNMCECVYNRL